MDIKERTRWVLADIVSRLGIQYNNIADELNVSRALIYNYKQKRNIPNAEFVENLCKRFNVNPFWMVLGEGDPYLSSNSKAGCPDQADASLQKTKPSENSTQYAEYRFQENSGSVLENRHLKQIIQTQEALILSHNNAILLQKDLIASQKEMLVSQKETIASQQSQIALLLESKAKLEADLKTAHAELEVMGAEKTDRNHKAVNE